MNFTILLNNFASVPLCWVKLIEFCASLIFLSFVIWLSWSLEYYTKNNWTEYTLIKIDPFDAIIMPKDVATSNSYLLFFSFNIHPTPKWPWNSPAISDT